MLPILLDLLDTNSDMELRPLTGLLRNLARHSPNKDHMGRTLLFLLFFVALGLEQTLTLLKGQSIYLKTSTIVVFLFFLFLQLQAW